MEINSSLPLWTTRSDTRLAEVAKAAESTRTVVTPRNGRRRIWTALSRRGPMTDWANCRQVRTWPVISRYG